MLTCQDTAFSYDGKVVVEHLNFQMNAGDYLCVVGENGAGKTTLIRGILGLIPCSSGRLFLDDSVAATEVGYLPQKTEVQRDFPASVFEVVLSGRLNKRGLKPFYSKADKQIAADKLKQLNIEDLKRKSFRELSGGQQQRVLLARALCAADKLLLLDEPVAGLDPLATRDFYQLIDDINRTLGIGIIMVSHNITDIMPYATHILHLGGEQLFFGTAREYRQSDAGRRFLG